MKLHTKSLPGAAYALGLTLLLLLALALLSAPAYADEVSPYGLYVGGTAITSNGQVVNGTGGGTATFTVVEDVYTLTLDAYVYSGEGYNHANYRTALFYNGTQDLTIVLKGESSLTTFSSYRYICHGMYFYNTHYDAGAGNPKLTIQSASGGSLKSEGENAATNSYGISTLSYDLLLDGADVRAHGGSAGYNSVGIKVEAGTLEIGSGAYLTAFSDTSQNASSIGVSCSGRVVVSGGTLYAGGDSAGNNGASYGIGISSSSKTEGGLSVTGGWLTATGKSQAIKLSNGVSLSVDGMMIQAGESKSERETVTGDGWKTRKYVIISPPTYDLWIGGEEVTPANSSHLDSAGHGWSFDPTSYTLTLNAYTYAGEGLKSVGLYHNYYDALHYEGTHALTIDLVGDNCLTQQGGTGYSCGIVFAEGQAAVTIQSASGGTLTVNAVGDSAKTTIRYGIDTSRPLTISGAAVTVNIPSNDNGVIAIGVMHSAALRIEGGSLKAVSGKSVTSVGISQASNTAAVTLSGASSLIACTLDDANASDKCAISSHDSLNPDPGMTVLAGAAADSAGVVSGDGWKNQKYVKIFKQYGLWIGEEEVTSAKLSGVGNVDGKKGTWTFTPANPETGTPNTLTLNGYNYDGPGYLFYSSGSLINYAALYYSGADNLVIELVGDNSITRRGDERSFAVSFDSSEATVTIRSDSGGALTVNAVGNPSQNKDRFGINAYGNLCITDAAVTVNAGPTSGSAWTSGVSYMKQLLIDGGSLKAVGGDYGYYTDGIYATSNNASLTVKNGGSLLAVAGKGKYSHALVGTMESSVTVSDDSTLVAYTTADDTATMKCAIDNVTLSAPGMTIRAGASEGESSVVTGDGWKEKQYVKIYKSYNLWVGGEEVTSTHLSGVGNTGSKGSWSFDPDAYVLTLDAYAYSGPGHASIWTYDGNPMCSALYYAGAHDLTIELSGENVLTQLTAAGAGTIPVYSDGICVSAINTTLSIRNKTGAPSGTSLTVTGGAASDTSTGIYVQSDLVLDGVVANFAGVESVYSAGADCYNVTITDSEVYASAGSATRESIGVFVQDKLTLSDSMLAAVSEEAADYSAGVYCSGDVIVSHGVLGGGSRGRSGTCEGVNCIRAYLTGADTIAAGLLTQGGPGDGFVIWDVDGSEIDPALGVYFTLDPVVGVPTDVFFDMLDAGEETPLVLFSEMIPVTLDANGGAFGSDATKRAGAAPGTYAYLVAEDVAAPTRSGFTLTGWGFDPADSTPLDKTTKITGATTLYALWNGGSQPVYSYGGDSLPPAPKAAETAHGTLSFEPKNPASGATVTVTATPDAGYVLESLTAQDSDGRDVPLTKSDDGTWSFQQGAKQVTVTATFKATADPLAAFRDVDAEAWYADELRWALTEGVMEGYGDGTFGPGDVVSRGMVLQVLWKLAGCPAAEGAAPFGDVDAEAWYATAVAWGAETGLTEGYADGTFRADRPVTREELAVFLYRFAQSRGLGFTGAWMFPLDFDDAAEIAPWADEAVHWMVMQGVINGRGDGLLAMGETATRAELAAMLHRFSALLPE